MEDLYAQIEHSTDRRLWGLSQRQRRRLVKIVLEEFGRLDRHKRWKRRELESELRRNVKRRVGFPWALFVSIALNLIINALLDRWFKK